MEESILNIHESFACSVIDAIVFHAVEIAEEKRLTNAARTLCSKLAAERLMSVLSFISVSCDMGENDILEEGNQPTCPLIDRHANCRLPTKIYSRPEIFRSEAETQSIIRKNTLRKKSLRENEIDRRYIERMFLQLKPSDSPCIPVSSLQTFLKCNGHRQLATMNEINSAMNNLKINYKSGIDLKNFNLYLSYIMKMNPGLDFPASIMDGEEMN